MNKSINAIGGIAKLQTEKKPQENRASFALSINPGASGAFDILTISAGMGNGWHFSPEVLQASLSLWDGVECFIDHSLANRSVRDIAGIIQNPTWDATNQAIRARLKPFGPAASLLQTLADQLKASPQDETRIGFSADLVFKGRTRQVEQIIKVNSVDLVYNPARGGKFVFSLYNSEDPTQIGDEIMGEIENKDKNILHEVALSETDKPFTDKEINAELNLIKTMRTQMSQWTVDLALDRSKLPRAMQDVIRKQFAKREFTTAELDEAIEDQRKILSQLTGSESVRGAGRVEGMTNEEDRLRLAVEDLFGIEREFNPNLRVPRLTGIRELYLMLTGDTDLHGGYYPERMQLATTADFTGLVKNALNKIVVRTWSQLGKAGYDWWKDISTQEHFSSLHDVTGTLIGTVGDLPAIAEGAEYTELPIGDSPETASFTKYGGYIPLTLELIDRDDAKRLSAYARQLGSAGLRKISKLVAEIFTANSGIGPTMADTGALFNATAVTTAGGHANLTTSVLSASQWDTVSQAVYKQPMLIKNEAGYYGTGPAMAINPKFMMIPRNLGKTAWEICAGNFVREEGYVYDNIMKGTAVPVIVPEWTDGNNWAAVCDPVIMPAIYVGERFGIMPEIFVAGENTSPAVFMNDEHRLKVRHFLAVWVNDFRPLHKANVT